MCRSIDIITIGLKVTAKMLVEALGVVKAVAHLLAGGQRMPGPAAGTAARGHSVISSGLRWAFVRIWALPAITTQAPSERYHRDGGIRRKTVADWAS